MTQKGVVWLWRKAKHLRNCQDCGRALQPVAVSRRTCHAGNKMGHVLPFSVVVMWLSLDWMLTCFCWWCLCFCSFSCYYINVVVVAVALFLFVKSYDIHRHNLYQMSNCHELAYNQFLDIKMKHAHSKRPWLSSHSTQRLLVCIVCVHFISVKGSPQTLVQK